MAIKTIKYEVNIAGITPATEQFGGTQGDHRVTQLKFALSEELYGAITDAAADGKARYRFDVYDGEGGVWSSDAVELADDTVSIELEERHTRFGGKITVYLVITALSEDNEAEVELYSFPAVLRLKNRPEGVYQDGENYESVTALAEVAKSSALAAENTNKELQSFAAEIEEKLKNGEFDGVGVESAEIINDELIITYTDGVVENLGNVKGDKGDIGPQGEKGDAGKDAVTDQIYDATSENAQSGIAVAEAVQEAKDKCVPIPDYEETNDIEKVMVYDDHDYLEDENHNRYVNPKRFKPRPIDDGKGYNNTTGLTGSKADTANRAGYIAARDGNGNLWSGTPVDDQDCVPFKMVQNIQSDVDILQSETLKRNCYADGIHENVYANDAYGNQTTIQIEDHSLFESEGASGIIPRRQSNGNLHTNTPVKDIDCANKKYVDDAVKNIDIGDIDIDVSGKVDKIPSKQRETLDDKNGQIGVYATNDYSEGNPFLAQLHYNWEPYTIPYRLASGQIHVGLSGYDEINKESKIFQDAAVPKSYLAMVRTILENTIGAVNDRAITNFNTAISKASTAQQTADNKKLTSSYTSATTTLDYNSLYILWSNSGNADIELYNDSTNTRVADTAGETLATAKVCVLFLPESSTEITSAGVSKAVSKRCLYFGVTGTPSILNTNVVSKQFVVDSGNLYFTPTTAVSVFKIAL